MHFTAKLLHVLDCGFVSKDVVAGYSWFLFPGPFDLDLHRCRDTNLRRYRRVDVNFPLGRV